MSDRQNTIEHKATLPSGMTRDDLVEFQAELDAQPGHENAVITARVTWRGRIKSIKAVIERAPAAQSWEDRVRQAGQQELQA